MADYTVPAWVAVTVIVFTIGRTCIGFPNWLRQRLGSSRIR
jgi:hypothetical protein